MGPPTLPPDFHPAANNDDDDSSAAPFCVLYCAYSAVEDGLESASTGPPLPSSSAFKGRRCRCAYTCCKGKPRKSALICFFLSFFLSVHDGIPKGIGRIRGFREEKEKEEENEEEKEGRRERMSSSR